ncbi:EAL domain-containing protein [Escherichia coli]|uniref:EAL domain-containing protein n=1 Tax=Escherichia coli TaxID=562 RepID=UPI0001789D2B|nr:EAL domain-containing protein [Escherichia coli]EDV81589.1 putative cyclic diguanylate phosphodiesterase [Escherichia coli E22]EFN8342425.1 EAL domain-containing protein [Escherichia coli]
MSYRRCKWPDNDLEKACEEKQFTPYFQPLVTQEGSLCGVEILSRWTHSVYNIIPPSLYMPAIREAGLSEKFTLCMMGQIHKAMEPYLSLMKDDFFISFNLDSSACTPALQRFIFNEMLPSFDSAPVRFICELTEHESWLNHSEKLRLIKQFKDNGVQLAIDDFGTGFANLDLLEKIRPDLIKIDASFVSRMTEDKETWIVPEIALHIAQRLGIQVLAEGVETKWQWEWLKSRNVMFFQGYYFSSPVAREQLPSMLISGTGLFVKT